MDNKHLLYNGQYAICRSFAIWQSFLESKEDSGIYLLVCLTVNYLLYIILNY